MTRGGLSCFLGFHQADTATLGDYEKWRKVGPVLFTRCGCCGHWFDGVDGNDRQVQRWFRAMLVAVALVAFWLGTGCSETPTKGLEPLLCKELGGYCTNSDGCCEGTCRGCESVGVGTCQLAADGGAP